MNDSFWRSGRIVSGVLLFFVSLTISVPAQTDEALLPFQLKVKKSEFEKKLRAGLATVLERYGATLDALSQRSFAVPADDGLQVVAKEKEWTKATLKEIDSSEPLEFLVAHFNRLNRNEVNLNAHLIESTWKMDYGDTLTFLHDGGYAINGERHTDFGWQVADDETFFYGGGFWKAKVRDSNRRFTALSGYQPKKKAQGTLVDSEQYRAGPITMMAREQAKMKIQLATGVKALLQTYSVPVDQSREALLRTGNLDEALATKREWERLYEATEQLFGVEFRIGDPTEEIKPLCATAEELKSALTGTVWRKNDESAVAFRGGGHAVNKPYSPFPFRTGWQVLDNRRIVYGHNYYEVRFDPKLTQFTGKAHRSDHRITGVPEEPK